ncbi:putative nucleic acid-binding protein [Arthrobacter pigmenti]|uniref:Putative nucleic acid-binding protein n=1 Tax=Arthrobacter pigmenti TaxID=271432 RepID=A0A846RKT2_9MICC|nr:type II toxin-antitoxin system VapC family toxin [Arthrobacter pigmenti]NJC23823.1 putative nucleic acid-binding protein [Arthrobacter pigmenti]
MTRYVIDAPTLLHLIATNQQVNDQHQVVAPNLIRSQALALLFGAVQRGELSEAEALQQHERLTETKMRLLGDRVSRSTAWMIAREQHWESTHDAEYVAVAKLQADALISVDLAMQARAEGIVTVEPFEALFRA